MADYKKRAQTDNSHLANRTSAEYIHIDGTIAKPYDSSGVARRCLRVVIATKGLAFTVRNGSRVVGNFATTSVEGTYDFGVYCENGLVVDGVSGTGSAILAFGK